MMLHKNTKVKVHSLDGNKLFCHCCWCSARGYINPYLFIICLDYVFQTSIDQMKENCFTLKKARRKWCPTQTITDADYIVDIVLLANTPNQAKSLLHSLEQAAGGIGSYVNMDKTEYMCFNQKGDISTVNGGFLKLEDKFTYLGSSISSTENDINIQPVKAWTAINRLLIVWKSKLSDEIKGNFFQPVFGSILLYESTT